MNKSKLICVICRGFNKFFDAPKAYGERLVAFRTAIVIKKHDFYDEWEVYDALFWRIVRSVARGLNASIRIRCPESESGEMHSLEELRDWQRDQTAIDSEFGIDVPTEIRFLQDDNLLCLMSLEDRSDIGNVEPYSSSYTFSFYSYENGIDKAVNDSIKAQLSQEEEAVEIRTAQECTSPKWYWPLFAKIKSDWFLICVGFSVLVVFAIWLAIGRQ